MADNKKPPPTQLPDPREPLPPPGDPPGGGGQAPTGMNRHIASDKAGRKAADQPANANPSGKRR